MTRDSESAARGRSDDNNPAPPMRGSSPDEVLDLRVIPSVGGPPEIQYYIADDRRIIARIEETPDGEQRWCGHWRGGTNFGPVDSIDAVVPKIAYFFRKSTRGMPYRVLAWPLSILEDHR